MKTIQTESDRGVPLSVEVRDDSIRAFRMEKTELVVVGGEKTEADRKLEESLNRKPVMAIRKLGDDEFDVDFEASFQRGSLIADREALTEKVDIEMYGGPDIHSDNGWLEWIGIDPADRIVNDFIGR